MMQLIPSSADQRIRPSRFFFPGAAFLALASIPVWLLMRTGSLPAPAQLPPTLWHVEEMLFGYAAAVIAGYLLPSLSFLQLTVVAMLWVTTRLIWFVPGIPVTLLFAWSAIFPLVVALAGAKRFSAAKRNKNRVFSAILLMLAAVVLILFGAGLLPLFGITRQGLLLSLYLIVLLIIVMGGRLIPATTVGALRRNNPLAIIPAQPVREFASIIAMVGFLVFEFTPLPAIGAGVTAWLLAGILMLRLKDWKSFGIWHIAELWSLHMSYVWIVMGLVLLGFARLDILHSEIEALHALGAGGIGTITFTMMGRLVRLQSRSQIAPHWLSSAQRFLALAVLLRVFGPWLIPSIADVILWLSALVWSLCYFSLLVFLVRAIRRG